MHEQHNYEHTHYEQTLAAIERGKESSLKQFISFRIHDEDYAIDILSVREIKGWTRTTTLPNQPDYVRGVLNLRGAIVPVFDLSCRFGQGLTQATPKHVVIIVSVAERLMGLLVDTVSDILSPSAEDIGPVPELAARNQSEYLSGIITVNETMVVLLSLEALFKDFTLSSEPAVA
jgi:purine-binding chemotaxis protein CheW